MLCKMFNNLTIFEEEDSYIRDKGRGNQGNTKERIGVKKSRDSECKGGIIRLNHLGK